MGDVLTTERPLELLLLMLAEISKGDGHSAIVNRADDVAAIASGLGVAVPDGFPVSATGFQELTGQWPDEMLPEPTLLPDALAALHAAFA